MKQLIKQIGLASLFTVLVASVAQADPKKLYFFGNSLIHHLSPTTKTTLPHWMAHFAANSGRDFKLDGQWGFMREFDDKLPPEPEWEFRNVPSAWGNARSFKSVGYDTIVFNPTNFIQYRRPDQPYEWDNPTGETPVSVALNLLDKTAAGKKVFVYEGWADMDPFGYPPRKRKLRQYYQHNIGDYHDWYVDFVSQLQKARPDLEIELIPVATVLSRAFTETGLSEIAFAEIYADEMVHGTPTLYYLAAAITYAGLFDELPQIGNLPPDIHPLVGPYFDALTGIMAEEIQVKRDVSQSAVETGKTGNRAAPKLGMGLNGIADWSTQLPFLDHMKSARPWVGHLNGQWGGFDAAAFEASGLLDRNGWPTSMPEGVSAFETFVLTDMPYETPDISGLYRVRFDGQGKVDLTGRARAVRYDAGELWFRYEPGEGMVGIKISETDPEGTGDYIRNISIVHENDVARFDAGEIFNPRWTAIIQDMGLLRFMDWMQTNDAQVFHWEERPSRRDYSYMRRGVPLEVMLRLANELDAHPWFNMPHTASDAYVQGFAMTVKAELDPELTAYVEFSNELWNFIFPQAEWAQEVAKARWGARAGGDAWMQIAGLRAAEVMALWSDVYKGQEHRLKRVAAVHTGWPGLEVSFFEAEMDDMRPAEYFDAYAVTGYVGGELGEEKLPRKVKRWLRWGFQNAIEKSIEEIRVSSFAYLTQEAWPQHAARAQEYGLEFIMYEGGTHVVGHGEWVEDEVLTQFFERLNYSPEMGALYEDLFARWDAIGGKTFTAFVDVAAPSKWGSWGALRHLGDQNPRFDAIKAYGAMQ